MDVKEEHILGNDVAIHWYYSSKGNALQQILKDVAIENILDVGAGSGFFSRLLLENNRNISALCVDPAYETEKHEKINGNTINHRRQVEGGQVSLILMMDVLEHVDDDLSLIVEYINMLKQGGYLLVTVPAFQWLWSGHDEFLEHKRRYTAFEVEKLIVGAGLEVVRTRYFFALLLPLIIPIRLWDNFRVRRGNYQPKSSLYSHARWVNSILRLVLSLECYLLFRFNRIAGLTVFCLARKP